MLIESQNVKLRIMVPVESADKIRQVLGEVGASSQGNYRFCSGSYRQTGRFMPILGAEPTIGQVGGMETVEEEVIETLCHRDLVEGVLEAVKAAHPYEEPAIDIIPLLAVQ